MLNIIPEEERKLKTIISPVEKYRRKSEKRAQEREPLQAEKGRRDFMIVGDREVRKMSLRAIAKKHKVSLGCVQRVLGS